MDILNNIIDINYKKGMGITGITDEFFSLYLTELQKKTSKNILVVVNSLYEANKIMFSLDSYTPNNYLFPMDDFLTSEAIAISPDLEINRLETLNATFLNDKKIVVTNLMGYLRFLPEKKLYQDAILNINKGFTIEPKDLVKSLDKLGYKKESIVTKTGEFGIRGYVIDVYPLGEDNPVRIEFFGDEIDSIRYFNPNNQRSIKEINSIEIRPISEFICSLDEEIVKSQKYLPDYINCVNITKYLDDCIVIYKDYSQLEISYKQIIQEVLDYRTTKDIDFKGNYMFDFNSLDEKEFMYYLSVNNLSSMLDKDSIINYNVQTIQQFNENIESINNFINNIISQNKTVIICILKRQKKNLIKKLNMKIIETSFDDIHLKEVNIVEKELNEGFIYNDFVFLTAHELFISQEKSKSFKTKFKYGSKIKDINNLEIGDYVVHNAHGIGIYNGIKVLTVGGISKDYIEVLYSGKDKLYIPVEKIDLLYKYVGKEGMIPKVNKMDGIDWKKTKQRVRQKVADMADRLLCGDVGFGKTEVAFRAAMKAVADSKQVLFLCPTTILSTQHYENALKRFKNVPVNIALLNRFTTPKEQKRILDSLKSGIIDIVFGTHRLLSSDVEPVNLGLLVIDEEQRFGVVHKEKIKAYKTNVDVLTLTATPIPRTLQMSMVGMRSLSLIETPPVDRYPIQTYVVEENKQLIKDAIYKELSRKGQVFILYNSVEKIQTKLAELNKLVPEARITFAHGRMTKQELESKMYAFINHEFDILLCTTIIETGIDIPNVNTLIILNADRFGLSQLYQIRGRVGRSNKFAYAYLMYQPSKVLTETAIKRLNVIKEFTELGSGFSIATRDLSIRGAGDILGSEQAGFIDTVGIDLYLKMLDNEVNKRKGLIIEDDEDDSAKPLINVDTHIKDTYVSDESLKIEIHRMINEIDSKEKLEKIKLKLEDRFGKIDDKTLIYMYEEWFEKQALKIGIKNVVETKNYIELCFPEDVVKNLDTEELFMESFKISNMFRFKSRGSNLLIILDTIKLDKHPLFYLTELLELILNNLKNPLD